jgi:hypothetical protein
MHGGGGGLLDRKGKIVRTVLCWSEEGLLLLLRQNVASHNVYVTSLNVIVRKDGIAIIVEQLL